MEGVHGTEQVGLPRKVLNLGDVFWSRLGSLLPVVASMMAAVGVGCLVHLAPQFGIHALFPEGFIRRMTSVVFTVGIALFLVLWGILAMVMRPVIGPLGKDRDEQAILAEITRGLDG